MIRENLNTFPTLNILRRENLKPVCIMELYIKSKSIKQNIMHIKHYLYYSFEFSMYYIESRSNNHLHIPLKSRDKIVIRYL